MREETQWCTLCGARFTAEEVADAECCPRCGDTGTPCSTRNDVRIEVNWHELRILGIWAENWAAEHPPAAGQRPMLDIVAAITRRLQRQQPMMLPLTLSQEIAELPAALDKAGIQYGGVESNVARPKPVPAHGPGAVGHARSNGG